MSKKIVCCIRTICILVITVISKGVQAQNLKAIPDKGLQQQVQKNILKSNLRFSENLGQVADVNGKPLSEVLFTAQGAGMRMFITQDGIWYQFAQPLNLNREPGMIDNAPGRSKKQEAAYALHRFNVTLKGALKPSRIIKELPGDDFENFYLAHCPQGITQVRNYQRITLQNIYPNIDWVIYIKEYQPEYDFVIHPGGRIEDIQMLFEGVDNISLNREGALEAKTSLGILEQKKPYCYQLAGKEVKSSYLLNGKTAGFSCNYDPTKKLVIDPVIEWSTYYGGSGTEYIDPFTTIDSDGNVLLVGGTSSASEISQLGFQNTIGGLLDAYIVKFNNTGSRLWATYFGGLKDDYALAVTTDATKNVYICGDTYSTNAISFNAFQPLFGGGTSDGFLMRLNGLGQRSWSTYYGGSGRESATSCVLDGKGNLYLAGETSSTNFTSIVTTTGFRQRNSGKEDLFLVKFTTAGSRVWGTYYGGSEYDGSASCAVDGVGDIFLSGLTYSGTLISTSNSHQKIYGGNGDGVITKFTPACERLWGSYFGGEEYDRIYSTTTDANGNLLAAGTTASITGITKDALQPEFGGGCCDALVLKMASGGSLVWATYFGGIEQEKAEGISCDAKKDVYIAGYSGTSTGISQQGFQNDYGGGYSDAILFKLLSTGLLEWCSYLGGIDTDFGLSVKNDLTGNIYFGGITNSTEGIEYFGFRPEFGGGYFDAFLSKINDETFPVLLLDFQVTATSQHKALITWQTGSETNTREFVVERSIDGRFFSTIAIVAAIGSNSTYGLEDNNPAKGINYYRLKIIDKDGSFEYSDVKKISLSQILAYLAPNPVAIGAEATLYIADGNTKTKISICDVGGRILWQGVAINGDAVRLPVSSYMPGMYLVSVQSGDVKQVLKLIKQ